MNDTERPRPRAVIRLLATARANLATVDRDLEAAEALIRRRDVEDEAVYAARITLMRERLTEERAILRTLQDHYGLLTGVRTRPRKEE